ncbi:MAG: GxxExxY protein [Burkholderiales bacterium]
MDEELAAGVVVDAAIKVHSALGPGLLESAYQTCLEYELLRRNLRIRKQVALPVHYADVVLDVGYRLDLVVEDRVVVELKAVDKIVPLHDAQLLSYLKLGGYRIGLLINFHTVHLRDGIKRLVNGF